MRPTDESHQSGPPLVEAENTENRQYLTTLDGVPAV